MGVKGFRFVSDLFQICFIVQAVMSRPKGHFRLSDMPKYGALLFSKLKNHCKDDVDGRNFDADFKCIRLCLCYIKPIDSR